MPQIPTGRHLFFFPFPTILDGWSLALPYRIMEGLPVIRPESGQVGTGAAYRASYCETSGLLRFHPSGFDDTRRAFTLAQHEARKLRLRHAHWIGPVLRKRLAQIRRGQNARDVLR
jgi:hypothetical protein